MQYIEAVSDEEVTPGNQVLFLAGGITDCEDWQKELVDLVKDFPFLTVINPRRANFPMHDPEAGKIQIKWEFERMQSAEHVSFWFSKRTLCPITLYELGRQLALGKNVYIGMDPEYKRRLDVEIQAPLAGYKRPFAYSIPDLVKLYQGKL